MRCAGTDRYFPNTSHTCMYFRCVCTCLYLHEMCRQGQYFPNTSRTTRYFRRAITCLYLYEMCRHRSVLSEHIPYKYVLPTCIHMFVLTWDVQTRVNTFRAHPVPVHTSDVHTRIYAYIGCISTGQYFPNTSHTNTYFWRIYTWLYLYEMYRHRSILSEHIPY